MGPPRWAGAEAWVLPALLPSFPIVLRRVVWRRRMTPEFDEEVVFENSPLYQYLQDLGHTDFEICSSSSPKPEKCLTTEGPQPPPTRVLQKQGILLKLTETIKSWTFPSQHSKKDDLLHKLVLFQLWVAQSSEFFRRLALLLSTANTPSGPLLTAALLPHHILCDVTQGLPHAHSACLEELKRSYEFFRYFETQHQSVPQRLSKTPQKSRELSNVHTAVRSLQLHLKALLNEVIILEDELEKLVCTKETQELLSEAYPILEQKLKLIEPHVQASNSCWEEAISQVDKLLRRNTDKKGKPGVACENPHCTAEPLVRPALHIEDRDPIPEEQELEAYVDDIDIESEFRKDDLYHLSQEDRERQKREQEESRRVLQELKSVLGFKASEAERQKWKQLLFSDHGYINQNLRLG